MVEDLESMFRFSQLSGIPFNGVYLLSTLLLSLVLIYWFRIFQSIFRLYSKFLDWLIPKLRSRRPPHS